MTSYKSKSNYLSKAPSPNTSTLSVQTTTYEWGAEGYSAVHSNLLCAKHTKYNRKPWTLHTELT